MIAAMVAKFQLVGLAAQREPRQLMSQADSENRLPPHQPADIIHRVAAWLRISWAIREKHPIRFHRQNGCGGGLRCYHRHPASLDAQLAQEVLLDAAMV